MRFAEQRHTATLMLALTACSDAPCRDLRVCLQACMHAPPNFVCGSLLLLCEVVKQASLSCVLLLRGYKCRSHHGVLSCAKCTVVTSG